MLELRAKNYTSPSKNRTLAAFTKSATTRVERRSSRRDDGNISPVSEKSPSKAVGLEPAHSFAKQMDSKNQNALRMKTEENLGLSDVSPAALDSETKKEDSGSY